MTYTDEFYAEEGRLARESAEVVIPRILDETAADSMIDLGCGTGEWVKVACEHGCLSIGVDLNVPKPLRPGVMYIDHDLTGGYPCSGFVLALCLEVAEHLPESAARPLIRGLARADTVLFSAATPGQPGVGHINCQPHDYWHDLFAARGLFPLFVGGWFDEPVADFYRRNLHLYRRAS